MDKRQHALKRFWEYNINPITGFEVNDKKIVSFLKIKKVR